MPEENLPPIAQDRLDAVLSEWDDKIDRRIADAKGVHGTVQALEQAKHAELTGTPPEQIVTRRERSMVGQPKVDQTTNDGASNLLVIVPPNDAPMILEVRSPDGVVFNSQTVDPSDRPTKVRIDGLPPGPAGLCLAEIVKARRVDLRPGRFKIKM